MNPEEITITVDFSLDDFLRVRAAVTTIAYAGCATAGNDSEAREMMALSKRLESIPTSVPPRKDC